MPCLSPRCYPSPRILAGWVPAKERIHIDVLAETSVAAAAAAAAATPPPPPQRHELVLWPYDRGESRGKLRGVTLRISPTQLLVLGFR